MALADTAKLVVDLSLKGNFTSQIGKASKSLGSFDAQLDKTESRAYRTGQQIGTGINNGARIAAVGIGLLVSQIGFGLRSLVELEQRTTQTNAVIKSTGGIAGVSAEMVRSLAEEYEALNATIGDETIQNAENLLLTFTNIRKDAFEPTLAAILDMNQALGGGPEGLTGIAQLVGRALDNPEKGLQLLERRIGKFTDAQRAQIKEAVEQNRLFDAQAIILDKLNTKYGGSFLAGGTTTAGKVAKFTDSIEDLQRTLAAGLLPVVSNVADALSRTLGDPKVQADVERFGKQLAGLFSPENLATAGGILKEVFQTARDAAPVIAASAQIMGQVVGTAVGVFKSLPPEIQRLAIGAFAINKLTGGLVTNLAGGLISSVLKQLVSGVVNVSGAVVNVTGAPGLVGDVAKGTPATGGKFGFVGNALKVTVVGAVAVAGIEAGAAIAGINDPRHQIPGGGKNRFGDDVFRGTNVIAEQIGHLERGLEQLDRRAAEGDRFAARQADQVRAEIARLRAAAVSGLNSVVGAIGKIKLPGAIIFGQAGGAVPRNQRPGAGTNPIVPRPAKPKSTAPSVNDATGFVVKVTSSIRDTNTAQDTRLRWGKTPTQVGAA